MARKIGNRKRIVRFAINEIFRERAAHRVASPIGQLGLQNAGSTGADKHANALRTVFCDSRVNCFGKSVLHESQQREPIIATVKVREMGRQLDFIHATYFADESRQVHRVERAWSKSGAALTK